MAGSYNLRRIQATLIAQAKKPIEHRVEAVLHNKLEKIKNQTLQDFENNSITKEIESRGDLFGFIGFNADEEPTQEVREYLEDNIFLLDNTKLSIQGNKIIATKTVQTPSLGDAYENIQSEGVSEWSSKSWLQLIEDGIPFFSKYLRRAPDSSRSQVGIQSKNNVRSESYGARKYLSEILANLRKRISSTVKF